MTTTTDREIRYSEIKRFKRCRRSWYNGYYLNYGLPEFSGEHKPKLKRDVGTLVHQDLERYYNAETVKPGDWLSGQAPPASENFTKEWSEVYVLAQIMLDGYAEWLDDEGEDAGEETYGTEVELKWPVPGTNALVVIHIDRIVYSRTWDRYIIEDTKTVDSLEKGQQFAMEEQLLTYAFVANEVLDLNISECRHNMLRRVKRTARAKPPFYGRETIEPTKEQLYSHKDQTIAVVHDILGVEKRLGAQVPANQAAYPNATRDCSWDCDFLPICPMHDDGSDVQGIRNRLYIKRKDQEDEG